MDMDVDGASPLGDIDESHELIVTFNPPLFLERRGWVLDVVREEGVTQVRFTISPRIRPIFSS